MHGDASRAVGVRHRRGCKGGDHRVDGALSDGVAGHGVELDEGVLVVRVRAHRRQVQIHRAVAVRVDAGGLPFVQQAVAVRVHAGRARLALGRRDVGGSQVVEEHRGVVDSVAGVVDGEVEGVRTRRHLLACPDELGGSVVLEAGALCGAQRGVYGHGALLLVEGEVVRRRDRPCVAVVRPVVGVELREEGIVELRPHELEELLRVEGEVEADAVRVGRDVHVDLQNREVVDVAGRGSEVRALVRHVVRWIGVGDVTGGEDREGCAIGGEKGPRGG